MPKSKYTKRADGRYLTQIQIGYQDNGKPKYKNIYGRTILEVDKKAAEFKNLMYKGVVVDDKRLTVGQWAEKWLRTYKNNVSYNTYEMYHNCIKNHIMGSGIENIPLSKLNAHHVQLLINEKVDAGLTRTVKILQLTLKQLLKQAVENELIYKNAAENIKIPTFHKDKKRALTSDERNAILQADLTEKERLFVYFGLYAGLRRGEILALTWDDIDLRRRLLHVRKALYFQDNAPVIKPMPKTEAGIRDIPIPQKLFDAIRRYGKPTKSIYLFQMDNGGLITKSSYTKLWKRIDEKVNRAAGGTKEIRAIGNFTCHILRHTYATKLYYAGIDIKTAQRLLGHSSITMTMDIYTHLEENHTDILEKLNDL